jgi:hypothetical protein
MKAQPDLTGSNRIVTLTKAAATAPKGVRLMRRARHGATPRTHQAPKNEASDRVVAARPSFEHPQLGQALVPCDLNSACDPTLRSPEPLITGSFYLEPTRLERGTRRTAYYEIQVDRSGLGANFRPPRAAACARLISRPQCCQTSESQRLGNARPRQYRPARPRQRRSSPAVRRYQTSKSQCPGNARPRQHRPARPRQGRSSPAVQSYQTSKS